MPPHEFDELSAPKSHHELDKPKPREGSAAPPRMPDNGLHDFPPLVRQILDDNMPRMVKIIRRRGGTQDDAEALLQEVSLRVIRCNVVERILPEKLPNWLLKATRRLAERLSRKSSREAEWRRRHRGRVAEYSVEVADLVLDVRNSVSSLDVCSRDFVEAGLIAGRSLREYAEHAGVTLHTARQARATAVESLRVDLGAYAPEAKARTDPRDRG